MSVNFQPNPGDLGPFFNRPVCNLRRQTNGSICQQGPATYGNLDRRDGALLDGRISVGAPAVFNDFAHSPESGTREGNDGDYNTAVDGTAVVPEASAPHDTPADRHSASTLRPPSTPPGSNGPNATMDHSRLASIRRCLQTRNSRNKLSTLFCRLGRSRRAKIMNPIGNPGQLSPLKREKLQQLKTSIFWQSGWRL